MSRFSEAAELWVCKVEEMVNEGRRSPGTAETYRRQLKNHLLPAMGEVWANVDRNLLALLLQENPDDVQLVVVQWA